MPAVRKYPQDLMDRAVAMVLDIRRHDPGRTGVVGAVGELLGVHPEVLRHWVRKSEAQVGDVEPIMPGPGEERVTTLERENAELKRANAVLRAAAILFACELEHTG